MVHHLWQLVALDVVQNEQVRIMYNTEKKSKVKECEPLLLQKYREKANTKRHWVKKGVDSLHVTDICSEQNLTKLGQAMTSGTGSICLPTGVHYLANNLTDTCLLLTE